MDELICPESLPPRNSFPREHSPARPWSLSAWRRFAPTVPVLGFGKRSNPRYLPVLENTCPQPTSVQERLSPRLYSPWSKTEKKEKQTEMIPITHPLAMRTNRRTDGRTDSQCLVVLHRPRFPGWKSIFLSIPTGKHTFLLSFQTKCDFAMIAP